MHRSKRKRNIIIFSLIGVLLCMVAGYAAFQTQLKVTGSSTVTSNWDIEITNVTAGTPTGSAENAVAPSFDKLWASMEANLYDKGDAMEYDVTIENKGTLDAKLNDILTNLDNSNNEAVIITFSGYTKGEILKAGNTKIVHVKIEYNPEYEGGETSSEVEINFDYTQDNKSEDVPKTYLLTYDYQTNGGERVDSEGEYLTSGNKVDLSNKAYKNGWNFVGWNTDKDAIVGLKEYQMPTQNTTLYAIYSKTLSITYQMGSNVESIGQINDNCNIYNNGTSCEITLPSITAKNGYSSVGWSMTNGDTTGTAAGNKITISDNNIYYANAIDNIKPTLPSITNSSNGNWTSGSVTITLTSKDEGSGIDHYEWYENGAWTTRELTTSNGVGTITFTSNRNATIQFRVVDKAGNISEIATTPVKIDTSNPTLTLSTTSTTNSITAVANASATSGIAKYEYSKDGGKTWATGTGNTYKFTGLTSSTSYNIMVRVTSNSGKTASSSRSTTTGSLSISFSVKNSGTATSSTYGWAASKTVTATFSQTCGQNGITCTYTHTQSQGAYYPTNEKQTVTSGKTASHDYNSMGTMVATISNGTETKSSTYTVNKIGNAATTLINKGIVTSGAGLYVDPYEASSTKDRFIYRGMGGNNYAMIEGLTWDGWKNHFRIVAIEPDGTLKLVRNNVLYSNMQWSNSASHRWNNSTLRNYINTNFKSYLNSQNDVASRYFYSNRNWYYGDINYDANQSQTLVQTIQAEKSLTLSNNDSPFGVLNISDYIKASSNANCKTLKDSREGKCGNNWLWRDGEGILATPSTNGGNTQGAVVGYIGWGGYDGVPMSAIVKTEKVFNVRPAGYYVAHAHIISGTGTGDNPYILSTY